MNRRHRRLHYQRSEPYLRYLKPGALAQLRDSRISTRLHRIDSLFSDISPPRQSDRVGDGQPEADRTDGPPCFAGMVYGPRCPLRKKLAAAKYVWFVGSGDQDSSALGELDDPVVGLLGGGNDGVAAH